MVSASLLLRSGGVVVIVILIPLPEGRWEGGHDLSPSPLEKGRSVVIVTLHPSSSRKERWISWSVPLSFLSWVDLR